MGRVARDEDAMTEWQYFLTGGMPERADEGKGGLIRLPVGGPVSLAESLDPSGGWSADDRMWRVKYLGSDYEMSEISTERAHELMGRWVEIGRIAAPPSEQSSIPAERAAELIEADHRAAERWQGVTPPPGAGSITLD
jgi:hypothetical protein